MPLNSLPKKHFLVGLILVSVFFQLTGCASREEKIQKVQKRASDAMFQEKPDPERAIEILSKGLRKYPDSNAIRIELSKAMVGSGDLKQSVALLEEAIEQDPSRDQLWVNIGELHARLGNSEKAILALESYLTNHGDDFLAWKALTLENEKSGKLTGAIKAATRWNKLSPSAPPALKLGELFLETSNIPQARSWFGQGAAYEESPAAKEAIAELIKLETSLKQFQQASSWLETYEKRYGANSSDPRIRESKTVLASWIRARQELAKTAQAIEKERRELEEQNRIQREEQEAIDWQPLIPIADNQRTDDAPSATLEEFDMPETETRQPETLFGGSPTTEVADSPPAREESVQAPDSDSSGSARAALRRGNYDDAITKFWQLLGTNSDNPELWYLLSTAYYAQSNWFDAEACILEAKRRAPRSGEIASQYAMTIVKTQNAGQALEEIKGLRQLFPTNASIALTHARKLREANASRSMVNRAYQDFLTNAPRNDPAFPEATRYLQSGN